MSARASHDVIVIGGGAIGAACARELALAGRTVLILEPDGLEGRAWRAAGGMLAPQIEAHEGDPLFELALAGRERYPPLAAALRETTGIDVGLWQEGIAHVARSEAHAAELQSKAAWQRQHGHRCDWLDSAEVKARWPWLGASCGALWAPREGALEPDRLVEALLADARRCGATLARDAAVGIEQRGDQVIGVVGRNGRYPSADVVVAAGAWSGRLDGLPRPLSVEPVRGQIAALPWPAGVPRAIIYNRDCYLLARGGEALVGSTMEYAGFRAETTAEGLARILAVATALCPALSALEVQRTWAGLRPMTPDGLPIIGAEPRLRGLWYATGHGRNGILLAAITGAVVKQLLGGEPAPADLQPFSPARFWNW